MTLCHTGTRDLATHLRAADERDEVSVRVLTPANGPHGYWDGPFTILDFAEDEDPSVVYVETLVGSRYIERPQQVAAYRRAYEGIRRHALPLKEYLE